MLQRIYTRVSKPTARYSDRGSAAEHCSACRFFMSGGDCARVLGRVLPQGWCKYFSREAVQRYNPLWPMGSSGPPGVTLDLSFMTPGTLDPRLTFTRASTATYFDATGTMQTAAANSPRWDYNPGTLALNGLLIEEARTNNSTDYTGYPGANTSHVPASGIAPDGTNTMVKLAEATGTSAHYNNRIATLAAGTMYTLSVYAKAVERRYIQLYGDDGGANGGYATFDLQTGTISQPLTVRGTGVTGTATIQAVSNGIYRCTVSVQVAVTTYRCGVILSPASSGAFAPSYAGVVGSGALIWGLQLEAAAFASSYVPTTTVGVTRAAETCTMPTSTWFNAPASSLAAEFMVAQTPNPSGTLVRDACALSDGSANNRLMLRGQIAAAGTAALATAIAGTSTASGSLGATTANAVAKVGAAWNVTTGAGSLNGGAVVSYAVGMPAGLTTLAIGNDYSGATAYLNGWVQRVRYWPRALSNTELQSVTT